MKVDHGVSVEDAVAAIMSEDGEDSAPGTEVGWMGPFSPGQTLYLESDLEPGSYVALCFIPGADGAPHVMQGMVNSFTVA